MSPVQGCAVRLARGARPGWRSGFYRLPWAALLAQLTIVSVAASAIRLDPVAARRSRLPLEAPAFPRADSANADRDSFRRGAPRRSPAWSVSVEQAVDGGTSGPGVLGGGAPQDDWAQGAGARSAPEALARLIGDRRLHARGHFDPLNKDFSRDTVQMVGREFANQWVPVRGSVGPDGAVGQRFGDDFRLPGLVLQFDEAAHWLRAHSKEKSQERLYLPDGSTVYDYGVERGVASTRLGGTASVAARLARGHDVRVRAAYDRDADDEGRNYDGQSVADRGVGVFGSRRDYVQRATWMQDVSGDHVLGPHGLAFSWSAAASRGDRLEPDRRESNYLVPSIVLFDSARREFGETHQHASAMSAGASLPLGPRGAGGHLRALWRQETGHRDRMLRRFEFQPGISGDRLAPPESLFAAGQWATYGGALIDESTLNTDNGWEGWRQDAASADLDLAVTRSARVAIGARGEHAVLEAESFLPWSRGVPATHTRLDERNWLPSASVAWKLRAASSLRLAAVRGVSRPSLEQFSPASRVDLRNGIRLQGNPALRAAHTDRYEVSWEAAGTNRTAVLRLHRTQLHGPVEDRVAGSAGAWREFPVNSGEGWEQGAELQVSARAGSRVRALSALSIEAGFATSASRVSPNPANPVRHSWTGSAPGADFSLLWRRRPDGGSLSVTMHHQRERLTALGASPQLDFRAGSITVLSARAVIRAKDGLRFAFAGENLSDASVRLKQGALEAYRMSPGRAWSAALVLGN